MAQASCGKGHIYDSDIYDSCPYCDNGASSIDFGVGAADLQDGIGPSVPVSVIKPEDIKKTSAPQEYLEKQDEIKHTRAACAPTKGKEPVVGWLVCVQGHDIGRDYHLMPRTNNIGRGGDMDVQIKGDDTITSNCHAKIDYDALNNDFYLLPANNRNTIYCNKATVYAATKLKAYDSIRLGKSEVLFVPFCNEHFTWPQDDGEE